MKKDASIFHYAIIGITILIAVFILLRYVAMSTTVEGNSMFPTLYNKDGVIIDKLAYVNSDPQRFDIVVFEEPLSENGYYIKRIIGLPGDTVQIGKDGTIYVNTIKLDESYGFGIITDPGIAITPITVGKDEYFVMGDNRNHSEDSRFEAIGNIERSRIMGKVTVRLSPIARYGYIDRYKEIVGATTG